jgi:hypothetical protein
MMKKPRSQAGAFLFLSLTEILAFAVVFAVLAVIPEGDLLFYLTRLLTNSSMPLSTPAKRDSALTTIRITL